MREFLYWYGIPITVIVAGVATMPSINGWLPAIILVSVGCLLSLAVYAWRRRSKSNDVIEPTLRVEVDNVNTLRQKENNCFLIRIGLTFYITEPPVNVAKLQLYAILEPIEPFNLTLPIKIEKKTESYIVEYEIPYYVPALARDSAIFGEETAYICARAEGKDWVSKEFAIPSPVN